MPFPSTVPAQAASPITVPSASATTTSTTVSPTPDASSHQFCQITEASNDISGPRRLEYPLEAVGEPAQGIAEKQIHDADSCQRFDRLERVVADAGGDRHQLADRQQGKRRA